ncbi:Glu/Leu/Phe/Val dehydrogenase dimerization domain-containing protein [Nocardioides ungokensis]|uniref:Glu/Leu/Phe/Val dehydrogenase dimerization domain-containing protein n=1 Tax=Nocardioides ungokensis TaxID=1643322 RepID=UPI0024834783|nr:Glu/Leu/Phe/Val dehydrogenase dimerization domain-containing protein [Nocardioides ungokensis]
MSAPQDADVFELGAEHEQVVFANDPATGLKAIVAIHSTALGPALGGTRFYPYASTADAVRDVLNLSRACPTRPRSPGSTSAAARRSSSATRRR